MILDKEKVNDKSVIETDLCIIGSGAAGITIALEFLNTETSVVMLTGGVEKETPYNQDIHRGASTIKDSHEPLEENRRRAFGGATLAWGGRCIPYDEIDMKKRDWIPDSEWPYTYDELIKYEKKAAELCDIGSFDFDALSCFSDNDKKEILKGLDNDNIISNRLERWSSPVNFAKRYKNKLEASDNIKVILDAHAVGVETEGENGCFIKEIKTVIGGKEVTVRAKKVVLACGGIETPRLMLAFKDENHPNGLGNNNDTVGRYYMAHYGGVHVKVNPKDRGNILFDFEKDNGVHCRRRWWVTEKFQTENKIGNIIMFLIKDQDQSGHRDALFSMTYMAKLVKSILRERSAKKIKRNKVAIKQHLNVILTEGWKQIPAIVTVAIKRSQKRRLPFVLPSLKSPYLGLYYQAEQTPCRESRLILSDREKDELGIPRVIPEFVGLEFDKRTVVESHRLFVERFKEADLGEIYYDEDELIKQLNYKTKHFNSAAHHIGTTRISKNPNKGVVDENCKVHNMNNLYIAGSSVFPTGSHVNPTLMVTQLSLKLADHIKYEFKNNKNEL